MLSWLWIWKIEKIEKFTKNVQMITRKKKKNVYIHKVNVKFLKNVFTLGHEVYKNQDVHIKIWKLKIDATLGTKKTKDPVLVYDHSSQNLQKMK
jgi:hypothetical protein